MYERIDLGGEWDLRGEGLPGKLTGRVPGEIYGDLLREKKIPDPFYRDNEESLQWIGMTDWIYSRTFEVSESMASRKKIVLCFEGLDTLAVVFLNGEKIGDADNMFRTWEWDIRKFLKRGRNEIIVKFLSVIPFIGKLQEKHDIPGWGVMNSRISVSGHAWIRKQACNFGWDWGIKALGCGIWRPVYIEGFDSVRILGMEITQLHSEGKAVLDVEWDIERFSPGSVKGRLTVSCSGKCVAAREVDIHEGRHSESVGIKDPRLWWPNGMGSQPLYNILLEVTGDKGRTAASASRRIGLRTLKLERKKDRWGESFGFSVNGLPFFAKGANWIPADALLSRMTPERYRKIVKDAAWANMNMLRVWGGGIYEDDSFYDACDEYGICVWQDFMFSCSSYPSFDRRFMRNVGMEARDNIRRLRHHACLALWCGNNEVENGGLVGAGGWKKGKMPVSQYLKLFEKLLGDIVKKEDPGRAYWRGSPSNPCGDIRDYNNPDSGDSHLWSVWHRKYPFEWYRGCYNRFVSEFGFQSFPEPETVYTYADEQDRNITSRIMEHHQRSGAGNTTIIQYMLDWFRFPDSFENTIWLSQILQGMAMKYACEHWRRLMPRCMGTLYWQLNDTWPVASWSSIDYFGRWKALHYMARRFYSPLLVSGVEDVDSGSMEIHVTSDLTVAERGEVRWIATDPEGVRLLSGKVPVDILPGRDLLVKRLNFRELIKNKGSRNILIWLELLTKGKKRSENLVIFARPKHLELKRPRFSLFVSPGKEGKGFLVELSSDRTALWCRLEPAGGDVVFSDNFFHMRPGIKKRVEAVPLKDTTLAAFKKRFRIFSLVDTF